MEARTGAWFVMLTAIFCFVAGCGKDEQPAGKRAGEGAGARHAMADTPDAAVMALIDGLRHDHPEAFWEFLPASFQHDLNELMHAFAERMDPELWNKGVAVMRKLAGVLKSKREFLPAADPAAGRRAPPSTDWVKLAEMLDTVVDSDLADLEKLKRANAGKIMAETGAKILGQARAFSKLMPEDSFAENLNRLADLKVALVSSSGDKAVLNFTAPGGDPTDVDFVRVEGKWIPQDLADEWIEKMGEARARLSVLSSDTIAEKKPQLLAVLSVVDGALDKLSVAKTRDDFNAVAQEAMFTLLPAIATLAGPPLPAADEEQGDEREQSGPVELVTVVVKGMLDDDDQDALRDRLNAVTDDRGRAVGEITGDDETTTFKVGPVGDVKAFADRIDFLKVTNVDAKNRVITAERISKN